jgi:hypothetical protein
MYNFKPYTGKTENFEPVFLKTTQVIKELCSFLIEDSASPSSGYYVCTDSYYTSPHLADELLVVVTVTVTVIVTAGTLRCIQAENT